MKWAVFNRLLGLALTSTFLCATTKPLLAQVLPWERDALITLYNSTNGANWTNKTNWLGAVGTECTWFGVTCSEGGSVETLALPANNLVGILPAQLGALDAMTTLDLSSNQLSGTIPAHLARLALSTLNLSNNQLNGSIPSDLGNPLPPPTFLREDSPIRSDAGPKPKKLICSIASNLTSLNLSNNQLTGAIPPELACFSFLNVIDLSNNRLSGTIPPDFASYLLDLTGLFVQGNQLIGPVPLLPSSLDSLNLSWNALFTNDSALVAFLFFRSPDWFQTQTIPPTGVGATSLSPTSLTVSWTPVSYTAEPGGYQILVGSSVAATVSGKAASSGTITGLTPGATYSISVQAFTNPHANNKNLVVSVPSAPVFVSTLNIPTPVIRSLSPSGTSVCGQNVNLTVTGTGFLPSSIVQLNRSDRATTYVSPTQLLATVLAADLETTATALITVANPFGILSTEATLQLGPTITSMSPTSANAGGAGFTLAVNGTLFAPGMVVRWKGQDRPTTFVSSSELRASIPASDISVGGTALISVATPGCRTSRSLVLTIVGPPVISSITPDSVCPGSPSFTLLVTGANFQNSNFAASSLVRWSGVPLPTTFVSSTELRASVSAGLVSSPGSVDVTVINLDGRTSSSLTLKIGSSITISPANTFSGSPGFRLAVDGTGFAAESVVRWNGSDRPTQFVNPTRLTASIPPTDLTTGNTANVVVFTPGCGLTSPVVFTVETAPATSLIVSVTDTAPPTEQPKTTVTLSQGRPVETRGQLELSFVHNADSPLDPNPEVQFSNGATQVDFTIPAGGTQATFGGAPEAAFQVGTVAGNITLKATLQSQTGAITTSTRQITINRGAPVVTDLRINRTGSGFEVTATGYSTLRSLRSATFVFTANSGSAVNNASHTLELGSSAATWFGSSMSKTMGSNFRMTVAFTFQGDLSLLSSASLTIANDAGTSESKTTNF